MFYGHCSNICKTWFHIATGRMAYGPWWGGQQIQLCVRQRERERPQNFITSFISVQWKWHFSPLKYCKCWGHFFSYMLNGGMAYGPWWLASKANYASYRTAQFHNFLHFCPTKVALFSCQMCVFVGVTSTASFWMAEWHMGHGGSEAIMRITGTAQFHNFIHFSSLKVAHFSRQMCVFVEAISATFCIFSVNVANWGLYWGPVPAIVHHWVVCHRLVI